MAAVDDLTRFGSLFDRRAERAEEEVPIGQTNLQVEGHDLSLREADTHVL